MKHNVNALKTEMIEKAVEALSHQSNLTITDVRNFLNKYSEDVKIEDHSNQGGEEVIRMKPLYMIYKYTREDENEIYSRAVEKHLNEKKYFMDLPEGGKLETELKHLCKLASFINNKSVKDFINWYCKFNLDLKQTAIEGDVKYDEARYDGLNLIINSQMKGIGKSHFIHDLIDEAKEIGIPSKKEVTLPLGGFYNTVNEAQNLIIGYQEFNGQQADLATLMHIARSEEYSYCEKCKQPINLRGRANTISSTNGKLPKDIGEDRGFIVVQCLDATYKQRQSVFTIDEESPLLHASLDKYKALYDILNKEDQDYYNTSNYLESILHSIKGIDLLQEVLQQIGPNEIIDMVSINWLSKHTTTPLTYNQKNLLSECLRNLHAKGILSWENRSNPFQAKYNLGTIYRDVINFECNLNITTIEDDMNNAWKEWQDMFAIARSIDKEFDGPEFDPFKEEVDDTLPDNMIYNGTFTTNDGEKGFCKPENVNKLQEYVCVNEPIDPNKCSRKNEDMKGSNFLCEMDDIPKEQQQEIIKKLPKKVQDSILWICDSGNKSIHTVIKTTCESNNTRIREYILSHLNKKYFEGHLDMSAKNSGRLGRNPNAYRSNGNKQQCYYMNLNAKPLNVDLWVNEEEDRITTEKSAREAFKLVNTNQHYNNIKHPLTVEYLSTRKQSRGRDKAILALQGKLNSWGDMLGAVGYLVNTGFTTDDIEDALPNDKWVTKELLNKVNK